jgi:uncharacterized protein YlzI (FlbEa/FlbD family)
MAARINLTNGDHIVTDADVEQTVQRIQEGLTAKRFVSVTDTWGHERLVNPAAVAEINDNPPTFG